MAWSSISRVVFPSSSMARRSEGLAWAPAPGNRIAKSQMPRLRHLRARRCFRFPEGLPVKPSELETAVARSVKRKRRDKHQPVPPFAIFVSAPPLQPGMLGEFLGLVGRDLVLLQQREFDLVAAMQEPLARERRDVEMIDLLVRSGNGLLAQVDGDFGARQLGQKLDEFVHPL